MFNIIGMFTTYRTMTLVIIASRTFARHNWLTGAFTIQAVQTGNPFANGALFSSIDTFGIILGGKIGAKYGGRIPMMITALLVSFLISLRLIFPSLDYIWVYVIALIISIMANLTICCLLELLPPNITYVLSETSNSISAFLCQITPFICRFAMPIPEYVRICSCIGMFFLYLFVNIHKKKESRR